MRAHDDNGTKMHKQLEIASLCVFSTTGIATYVDIFDYIGCKIDCKKNLKIIFLKEQLHFPA